MAGFSQDGLYKGNFLVVKLNKVYNLLKINAVAVSSGHWAINEGEEI